MKWRGGFYGLGLLIATTLFATAQCPITDFTIASTACLNQNIPLTSLSGSGSYLWDFCSGDLSLTPSASTPTPLSGAAGRPGPDLVRDGNVWYGFVAGIFSNSIFRMEFANGLGSAPTKIDDLGNAGGLLNGPGQVRVIKEAGLWYGIVHNTTTGDLIKLSFGSQLSNPIAATALTTGAGIGFQNSGFAIGKDLANGWVAVISNPSEYKIVRLGPSITSPDLVNDVITSISVASPGDLDIVNVCGNWYGLGSGNFGNRKIVRLDFGSNLFSSPSITTIISTLPAGNMGRIRIMKEGEDFFALVANLDLDGMPLFKLAFGNDITQTPSVVTEANLSNVPPNMYGLAVAKEKSQWTVMVMSQSTGNLYRVSYPNSCPLSVSTSMLPDPQISYSQAGTYYVSLEFSDGGLVGTKSKTILVSSSIAPDIDFSIQNSCVNNNIFFNPINSSGNIESYNWKFGDSNVSSFTNPAHVYNTTGNFTTELMVIAASPNSCTNYIRKSVPVYGSPVAGFTVPVVSPICTNQNYTILNTSGFDPATVPSWEWRLNGVIMSNQKDATIAFASTAVQEIKLKASIPGCENESMININTIVNGPLVDFLAADNCKDTSIGFSNATTGTVTSYLWTFGDGATSAQTNGSHVYNTSGQFNVTLTANNAAGCQNSASKMITVFSLPVPNFSIPLPPFSCSQSPTSFQNTTPGLTDSNITTWSWKFGDIAAGTSSQVNPSYVYLVGSNYNVVLTALSDKGCSGSVTKNISIATSPLADFTVGASCLNLGTKFTDISSGSVQTRAWQIASAGFSVPNPTYTFTSPGDFSATLTVTASNSCSTFKTKTIHVPVPPVLDFNASNLCSGQATQFADITSSPQDAIVGWNWNFAGNSATGNPANNTFASTGSQNVKMTTTHLSGCKYTLSKNVLINASPVADFITTPDRGSAPLIVQFTNTSQFANSYGWKFYDKVISTTSQNSPSHTFTSLGNYSAELTAISTQGCIDVKTVPIMVLVPAIDLALTDFTLTPDPVTGKLKGVVTILNKSNVPLTTAEIGLILADKAIVNETFAINLNPGQSISKTLSFTISPNQFDFNFLCAQINSEKDIEQRNNKRCVNLEKDDYFFSPYPNPTSGPLHVDWISVLPETVHMIIYDALGKKCYEWQTLSAVGLNQSELDVTFLSAGLYFLSVETPGSKKTSRIFKK